jgi:hypothetical protein
MKIQAWPQARPANERSLITDANEKRPEVQHFGAFFIGNAGLFCSGLDLQAPRVQQRFGVAARLFQPLEDQIARRAEGA